MFTLRNKKKQSGFTLMELLIVIAILGLLLGLIAPRLGGITSGTADNVCDTNNKGIRGMTALFLEQNGSLPGGLTNLVEYSSATAATLPPVQDANEGGTAGLNDETEILSVAFTQRNFPGIYQINTAEAAELRAMGVSSVFHQKGWDASGTPTARTMFPGTLENGSFVMMNGFSGNATTAALVDLNDEATHAGAANLYGDAATAATSTIDTANALIGNPAWAGRIIMAVNEQCELITSGLITASALCPTAVLAADEFSHDEFFIILPRLVATVAGAVGTELATLETRWYAIDEGAAAPAADAQVIDIDYGAQEAWQFDVSCPEGHKWPAADSDNWTTL